MHVLSRDKSGARAEGKAKRWKLEQTGGIDTKRVVNGAPGSPRTVCHAVITGNAARRARPKAGEGGEAVKKRKRENSTTRPTLKTPQGVRSKVRAWDEASEFSWQNVRKSKV